MTSEDFLGEILASPDDDTPRLIYADWLEERGDPRGEFIRVQCEVASLTRKSHAFKGIYSAKSPYVSPEMTIRSASDLPLYRKLLARQLTLMMDHCAEWAGILGPRLRGAIFSRGFVESGSIRAGDFAPHAPGWYRVTPLRQLRVSNDGQHLASLLQSPFLLHVHTLQIRLSVQEVTLLAACPQVANLRHLDVSDGSHGLGARGAQALLDSPYLKNLQGLRGASYRLDASLRSALEARFGDVSLNR